MSTRKGTTIGRAARTLWTELMGFRVHFPLHPCLEAAVKGSLRYYVYSDRLFLDDQELDGRGIPVKKYRLIGPQYNPLFIAWWGLFSLERYVHHADKEGLGRFLVQLEWLSEAARERGDGAVVWPCHFDWQEGRSRLKAPWISAMYQGVVMSALIRGYRLTGEERFLSLSRRASQVFGKSIEDGGVRTLERGSVLYEEYPAYPLPRILDGFLFSLLGLHDLYVETNDPATAQLFNDGIDGLRRTLSFWDYRGKWSWYGSHGYLCPPHYHALNTQLLFLLGRIVGDPVLTQQAEQWAPAKLTRTDIIEIYCAFLITKNWARLRLPNQKG